MATNNLKVALIGVDKSLSRTLGTAGKSVDKLASGMQRFGRAMTLGVTLPIAAAGVVAVKAASDLNESITKTQAVFGKSAKAMLKWSETSATAMGMSRQQALEASATFGNLFIAMKLPQKGAVDMARGLTLLAADIASFNNVPIEEALAALRSGLTGEIAPLRRFGVNLTDATLKEKAFAMGLTKTTVGALKPAAKAQAAYALIMEQTATTQGDFARTSEGLANKTRILRAQLTDIAAKLGTELLPVITDLASHLSSMLQTFSKLSPGMRSFAVKAALVAAAIGPTSWLAGGGIKLVLGLAAAYKQVAKWAGLAAVAQKGVGAGGFKAGGGLAAGAAGAAGGALAGAAVAVTIVAIAAGVGYLLGRAIVKAQNSTTRGKSGNQFGTLNRPPAGGGSSSRFGLNTRDAQKAIREAMARVDELKAKLAEEMTLGVSTKDTEAALKRAQFKLEILQGKIRERLAVGHITTTRWQQGFNRGEVGFQAFKSHVSAGIDTGPLNTSGWTDAMYRAYQIFLNIKAGMQAPISSHATVSVTKNVTTNAIPAHARGGIVTSPQIGLLGEAGPEAIIPLTRPGRAAQVMKQAGLGGDTYVEINLNGNFSDGASAGEAAAEAFISRARQLAWGY